VGEKPVGHHVYISFSAYTSFGSLAPSLFTGRGKLHIPFSAETIRSSPAVRRTLLPFVFKPIEISTTSAPRQGVYWIVTPRGQIAIGAVSMRSTRKAMSTRLSEPGANGSGIWGNIGHMYPKLADRLGL
jgi:hypothetical protein